jgi:hypothetical protein
MAKAMDGGSRSQQLAPDWRELERERVAAEETGGPPVHRVSWACQHANVDRTHGYNGIGLRCRARNPERRRAFYDA